ncbi:uncharacterized protein LODBEIA_P56770 [Lodderomyces beijingensis]|uniref:Uncharacterized protein n=1 Tax=Lodderomyces beijingensis TaxID=1775926 RepID=A0ABP0ZTI8_9ASCO
MRESESREARNLDYIQVRVRSLPTSTLKIDDTRFAMDPPSRVLACYSTSPAGWSPPSESNAIFLASQ